MFSKDTKTPINKITLDEALSNGGYYDVNGTWNSLIKKDDKILRERVETIIFNDHNQLYIRLYEDGGYRFPGGSTCKGVKDSKQALLECQQEAKIDTEEPVYTGISYIRIYDEIYDKGPLSWEGTLNKVFAAVYKSEYNGYIDKNDYDTDMCKNGKFVDITESLYETLRPEHKKVLDVLLKSNQIQFSDKKENIIESTDKSVLNKNFKKKSGKNFEYLDIYNPKATKLLYNDDCYKKNFSNDISTINGEIVIDKENNKIAGCVYIGNKGFIQALEVYKEYRGYGLSNKLLDDAIKKYNAVDLVVYTDNEIAINLYKKHGFVIIGYGNAKNKGDYWMKLKSKLSKDDKVINEETVNRDNLKTDFLEKGDICCNLDLWKPNTSNNILYITGLSGSGKTTLGSDLAKQYKCERVELDYISFYYMRRAAEKNRQIEMLQNIKKDCPLASKFLETNTYELREEFVDTMDIVKDFIIWFQNKTNGDTKIYIINGSHIASIYNADYFFDKPIIVKNLNWSKSVLRRSFREIENDKSFVNNLKSFYRAFKVGFKPGYLKDNKKFNLYRKDLKKNALTVESYEETLYPFYTPNEMKELGLDQISSGNEKIDIWKESYIESGLIDEHEWYGLLQEVYEAKPDDFETAVFALGWNPDYMIEQDIVSKIGSETLSRYIDEQIVDISENYVFSKKDGVYNFDKWESGESNIFLITGLSGSGKSTLAEELADTYNAEIIRLDVFQCFNRVYADKSFRQRKDVKMCMRYFKDNNIDINSIGRITDSSFEDIFVPFFYSVLNELSKDKNNRYIVEGIHIMLFIPYMKISSYPLYCKNTSMTKSIVRHWMRDEWTFKDIMTKGKPDISLYLDHEKVYNNFKSYLESSIVQEDAVVVASAAFLTLLYGGMAFLKIKEKLKGKFEMNYRVLEYDKGKESKKFNSSNRTYGSKTAKDTLALFSYYDMGINNAQKDCLLYQASKEKDLDKEVAVYKYNKDKLQLVYHCSFRDACKKNGIKLELMAESELSTRKKVFDLAIKLLNSEKKKHPEISSAVKINSKSKDYTEDYDKFINGTSNNICVIDGNIWDAVKNARSDEGQEEANKIVWQPVDKMVSDVNKQLPDGYSISFSGDWDDIYYTLEKKK